MLYCLKFVSMFLFRVFWNLLRSPYLSVTSALRYTKSHCQRKIELKPLLGKTGFNRPVFIDHCGNEQSSKKRHRRGHRGGKKHRKSNHHKEHHHEHK